jgi:5-methylcytosine-specific restriction protein A
MDRDAQYAYENSLAVRVIVLDKKEPSDERAAKRELDDIPWAVTSYNRKTGAWIVVRNAKPVRFVDQYSAEEEAAGGESEKRLVLGSAYVRDREVRDQALTRAGGNCEYCGKQGFEMANGNIYLETHHVVPLSEGGKDVVSNVAALCANHHRQAHHGKSRNEMRRGLLKGISHNAST